MLQCSSLSSKTTVHPFNFLATCFRQKGQHCGRSNILLDVTLSKKKGHRARYTKTSEWVGGWWEITFLLKSTHSHYYFEELSKMDVEQKEEKV